MKSAYQTTTTATTTHLFNRSCGRTQKATDKLFRQLDFYNVKNAKKFPFLGIHLNRQRKS